MSDRPEKAERSRVFVTFPKPHVDGLERLVREGVYMDRGEAIRAALRLLSCHHGLEPSSLPEGPPEEGEEEVGGPSEGS